MKEQDTHGATIRLLIIFSRIGIFGAKPALGLLPVGLILEATYLQKHSPLEEHVVEGTRVYEHVDEVLVHPLKKIVDNVEFICGT